MSFDHPYTCPDIDKQIKNCKDTVDSLLRETIEMFCPLASEDVIFDKIDELTEKYEDDFLDQLEEVRDTNENMREAAESQIEEYITEVADANEKNEILEEEIAELRYRIQHLEK